MSEVYWITKDKKKISVDDMSESHLRNALKMILTGRIKINHAPRKPIVELHGDMAQHFHDTYMEDEYDERFEEQY
jgi:hypothetical protein